MSDRLSLRVECGDALEVLQGMRSESVQCVVTSPPYWGLRDYGTGTWEGGDAGCDHSLPNDAPHGNKGQPTVHYGRHARRCKRCGARRVDRQIGLEATFDEFLERLVAVFREVRRVLRRDGTAWVNMGDSYASSGGAGIQGSRGQRFGRRHTQETIDLGARRYDAARGLKPKDLIGQPWALAFALRADGWYLRQDIIWHKPNPMPESVRDRCTKAHEYVFLLSKSSSYFFDQEAISEAVSENTRARVAQNVMAQMGSARAHAGGKGNGNMKAVVRVAGVNPKAKIPAGWDTRKGESHREKVGRFPRPKQNASFAAATAELVTTRNKRSVWTVPTEAFRAAHFATFPTGLVRPCILAGTRPGDVVMDCFAGSGTVCQVALELGRSAVGIELNPEYVGMIERRSQTTMGLPLTWESAEARDGQGEEDKVDE